MRTIPRSRRRTWAASVAALATFVGGALAWQLGRHDEAPRPVPKLAKPIPTFARHPALVLLREDTLARAKELRAPVDALAAAIERKDVAAARTAYLDARRRDRELQPIARDLAAVASSQLGAWGIDPDEASSAVGFEAMHAALFAEPPRWNDAAAVAAVLRRAADLLPRELELKEWTIDNVGEAVSDGVFAFGARLDGSDSPDAPTRIADLRAEAGGVLRAAVSFRDAAHAIDDPSADAIDASVEKIHGWLAKLGDEPHDVLDLLLVTGDLGAAIRRAALRLGGTRVKPPFAPRRGDPDGPITVATFPKMRRVPRDPALAGAGEALFRSNLLSRDRSLGCASCHDPARAFSRADPPVLTFDRKVPPRNAPGLFDVGYDVTFFWDGRASTLGAQIDVAVDRDMGGRWDEIERRVASDPVVAPGYEEAFHAPPSREGVHAAIEAYEETLVLDDTPFDRYVRGDHGALDADEKHGFDVFFGKARCTRCHRLPLTTGVPPPRFVRHELASIGVLAAPGKKRLDPDAGRYAITKREMDRGLFKVPSLRALALTAPYFHNGAYRSLADVVDFYAKGGGPGFGLEVPNAAPELRPFTLTDDERRDLLAFLVRGLAAP